MQSLRRVVDVAARGLKVGEQARTYKGLPVKKNVFVESWYNKREDMEYSAVITNSMVFGGFVWACAVPYFCYEGIMTEWKLSGAVYGTNLDRPVYPDPIAFET